MYWAVAIRHDSATRVHHPSAANPPMNFWARQANSGAADGFRWAPILRIAKGPSFRDIVTANDSPSRKCQWAIYVHISELHPWWHKMGREMRPLSAGPHQARCGQMDAEFSDYIIERRRARDIRPIGREVQRKRAPGARHSPVIFLISRRREMARLMRFPGN